MRAEQMVCIYALCEPESGELRYIGRSRHPQTRLGEHLKEARRTTCGSSKCAWIRSLFAAGQQPVLRILQSVTPEEASQAERQLIDEHASQGARLFNIERMPVPVRGLWPTYHYPRARKAQSSPQAEALGRQLRALRLARGWMQEDLARELGIAATQVSRWETGRVLPSLHSQREMCRVFDMAPRALRAALHGSEECI